MVEEKTWQSWQRVSDDLEVVRRGYSCDGDCREDVRVVFPLDATDEEQRERERRGRLRLDAYSRERVRGDERSSEFASCSASRSDRYMYQRVREDTVEQN